MKKKNKHFGTLISIVFVMVILLLDYIEFPSFLGFDMSNINWDFLNIAIVIILYIMTYKVLDERTVQKENNKKDITIFLMEQSYQSCRRYIDMLNQEVIEKYIISKVDFESTKNVVVENLQEAPFHNDNNIMDLVKDGQISRKQIEGYLKVKADYGQYINVRIVFYDAPEIYEKLRVELIDVINKELKKINSSK